MKERLANIVKSTWPKAKYFYEQKKIQANITPLNMSKNAEKTNK